MDRNNAAQLAPFRTLTTSARLLHSPSPPTRSSALLESVKQAEESKEGQDTVAQKLQEGGKGTEGAHYKGEQGGLGLGIDIC